MERESGRSQCGGGGAGMLTGKCVVLGITGGIAAYKAAEVTSRLKKQGLTVRVVMTENACRFIAPLTLETLSGGPVYVSTFEHTWEIEHISLAKQADLFLVAPATANFLGKLAAGIADDLLTTSAMATRAPLLLAPAMNSGMWRSAANQHNVEVLTGRGVRWVGPASGHLACGEEDIGRMSEPGEIVSAVQKMLAPVRDLSGRRVLVTAGPTREPIDPVRFLSNRSTGRMGYALAEAARDRGAEVTLVSGPVTLAPPQGVEFVSISTTLELFGEVTARAAQADVVIQAAAPADYRPEKPLDKKLKKQEGGLALQLTANPDIAAQLGREKRPGQVLVAFAAETNDLIDNARGKLARKRADLVVANDVTEPGAGFGTPTNRVALVDGEGVEQLELMSKLEVAHRILDRVAALLAR